MTVRYGLTEEQLLRFNTVVPVAVQVRQLLNANGFKFVDDGRPSAVVNENPAPIGVMKRWNCLRSRSIIYEQIY